MGYASLISLLEKFAPVKARLWTWEVLFPYDEEPSPVQLREMFRRDFPVVSQKGEALFLRMVAFNGESGRKIRYLVALAQDAWSAERRYDRALPESLQLYGIADEVVRDANAKICENVSAADGPDFAGNALFSFLLEDRLVILVFWGGRLCHWSEEVGYEEGFAGEAYGNRMDRFRKFLERDEYFSRGFAKGCFSEYRLSLESREERMPAGAYFRRAARDPFWRGVDLDPSRRLKPLVQKGLLALILVALLGGFAFWKCLDRFWGKFADYNFADVSGDIALVAPPVPEPSRERRDSSLRFSLRRKSVDFGEVKMPSNSIAGEPRNGRGGDSLGVPEMKLRSIVKGVVIQAVVDGSLRWLRLGDSVGVFVVKSIGRDRVQLEGGGRTVEVSHGLPLGE